MPGVAADLQTLSYDSATAVSSSDHKPVRYIPVSQFDVRSNIVENRWRAPCYPGHTIIILMSEQKKSGNLFLEFYSDPPGMFANMSSETLSSSTRVNDAQSLQLYPSDVLDVEKVVISTPMLTFDEGKSCHMIVVLRSIYHGKTSTLGIATIPIADFDVAAELGSSVEYKHPLRYRGSSLRNSAGQSVSLVLRELSIARPSRSSHQKARR